MAAPPPSATKTAQAQALERLRRARPVGTPVGMILEVVPRAFAAAELGFGGAM